MNPIKEIEELLTKVKQKFYTELQQPVEQPAQFGEYSLADGTTVMIDKMEIGGKVMANDAPVMDGEYQLADGTKMKVAGGAITEIEAPAPAEPAAPEDMSAKFAAIESRLQGFESALNASKAENENLKATFAKQEELNQHFIKMFETLVKEPTTTPTEPVKNGFRQSESRADKLQKTIALFQKQKN